MLTRHRGLRGETEASHLWLLAIRRLFARKHAYYSRNTLPCIEMHFFHPWGLRTLYAKGSHHCEIGSILYSCSNGSKYFVGWLYFYVIILMIDSYPKKHCFYYCSADFSLGSFFSLDWRLPMELSDKFSIQVALSKSSEVVLSSWLNECRLFMARMSRDTQETLGSWSLEDDVSSSSWRCSSSSIAGKAALSSTSKTWDRRTLLDPSSDWK